MLKYGSLSPRLHGIHAFAFEGVSRLADEPRNRTGNLGSHQKEIDHANYVKLQGVLADTSDGARVDYVNPGYGQGDLYNISGESVIRQFSYGIDALRKHFPNIEFTT